MTHAPYLLRYEFNELVAAYFKLSMKMMAIEPLKRAEHFHLDDAALRHSELLEESEPEHQERGDDGDVD